ncbi:MalM family protein [Marinobacter bohaiensis]|uniref:MalM family protein n=1 Tax=Marinobacter bohaiensis TaxID=2201898 RepID=UPI0013A696FB|nr:MalM family protein [Marinobacter bohaiensis]
MIGQIQRALLFGVGLGLAMAPPAQADKRYFTWVDEHGNVHHTLIRDGADPLEARARKVEEARRSEGSEGNTTAADDARSRGSTEKPGEKPAAARRVENDHLQEPDEPVASTRDANEPGKATAAPEAVPRRSTRVPDSPRPASAEHSGNRAADDTEYTLENFPDGDALARDGFVRDGDPLPYFTWRDAHGNLRVDYYRPKPGFEKEPRAESAPSLTPGLVIESRPGVVPAANRETLAVLGIDRDGTLLQRWRERCCGGLPVTDLAQWDDSREFQLDLDDLAPTYRFASGESVYRLVRLPEPAAVSAFVAQVRSYIDNTVFVPTLVFLDEEMAVQRLVTDLAFDYAAENWHRLGYLEARVPVFPGRGERWLLILSRQQDQVGQTVIESEAGPRVLHHAHSGLLGLVQLAP